MRVLDNIKQYADPHQVFVIVTGGEPLMREDIAQCRHFRYCLGSGMHLRDDEGRLIMCPLHRLK